MLKPDIDKYLPYVDHLDLTHEEKIELIHTVWHIMEAFVDSAFGMHPSQQVPGADVRKIVRAYADLVESDEQSSQQEPQ